MPKLIYFFYFFTLLSWLILHFFYTQYPHPITALLMILLNAISICMMMAFWQPTPLYSFILFLIMVSGLLIIFLYFSSLVTNDNTKFTINLLMLINFFINTLLFIKTNFMLNLYKTLPSFSFPDIMPLSSASQYLFKNLLMIYSYPYNNLTILCMSFLLIAMFTIIKMCTIKSSSLRKIS